MNNLAEKTILDACCGGKMCWFDKQNPHVLYVDNRVAEKGHISLRPNHEVKPDQVVDFRAMPYPDGSFRLVLFDPPHSRRNGKTSWMGAKYGTLNKETWQEDIRAGAKECFRVLEDRGVLVFKWASSDIPLREVLKLFPVPPLFGHTSNKHGSTHWLCFMKMNEKGITSKANEK